MTAPNPADEETDPSGPQTSQPDAEPDAAIQKDAPSTDAGDTLDTATSATGENATPKKTPVAADVGRRR
ncbi:hypothetical protein CHU98_g1563 [Xylaria longipes]|nr:hypothetical protein CHU98_g1563 [Xylaria longipes]